MKKKMIDKDVEMLFKFTEIYDREKYLLIYQ